MLISIPDQWLTDPPSPGAWRVWCAVSSEPSQLSIREIAERVKLCARVVARALCELHESTAPITYTPGSWRGPSAYEIEGGYVRNDPQVCIESYIPNPNNTGELLGGMDKTLHTTDPKPEEVAPLSSGLRPHTHTGAEANNLNSIQRVKNKQLTFLDPTITPTTIGGGEGGGTRCPYADVVDLFNRIVLGRFPGLPYAAAADFPTTMGGDHPGTISKTPLGARIRARWTAHGSREWFAVWFRRAVEECLAVSSFHLGDNTKGFVASMEWLLRPGGTFEDRLDRGYYLRRQERTHTQPTTAADFGFPMPDDPAVIDVACATTGGSSWQV